MAVSPLSADRLKSSFEHKRAIAWTNMLAGGAAGALSKTAVAPFERVKILCQNGASTGFKKTIARIYQTEGYVAFWAGNTANVLAVIPNRSIMYSVDDALKHWATTNCPGVSTNVRNTIAGGAAGATAVLTTYPLDVARGRMAARMSESRYKSVWATIRVTVYEEGGRGLYRGLAPTICAAFPHEGIKFGCYDFLMHYQRPDWVGFPLLAGGIAGAISGTLTYPLDTVRRRMQMQGSDPRLPHYRHFLHCFAKMTADEGVRSLFSGVTANIWRVVPAAGIQFAAFEAFKSLISAVG